MREHQSDWNPVLYSESVVWLPEEYCFGNIVGGLGAYYTTISYIKNGIEYEVLMENDEFILLGDFFEYDSDD